MQTCTPEECSIVIQLKKMNTKLTILTVMIALLLTLVAWSVYTILGEYDFEYETTTITIDSSEGAGDAIYQSGEGNIINGKSDSKENKIQPDKETAK